MVCKVVFVHAGTTQPQVTRQRESKMGSDGDCTNFDPFSWTCSNLYSERNREEEGCGGLPSLGGGPQPGQEDRGESQRVGERPNNWKVGTD